MKDMSRVRNLVSLGSPKPRSASWWAWLAILLLPIALLIPIKAEDVQRYYIGQEEYCCALSVMPEYIEKAEHAKSLRPISNLIIGGGLVIALVVAGVAIWVLACYALPCIRIKIIKIIATAFIAAISAVTIGLLLYASAFFFLDTDSYYSLRAKPPDDVIYAIIRRREWYNNHSI